MPSILRRERTILALILVAYVILGFVYATVTPVFEASDELWHYPMVRHLADGNPLPVQVFDPAEAGPWNQEASQPPLYYYLGAALTFWVETADMEQVRWLNPHVDNGVITRDGNTNLVVHDPAADLWQGTLLAVRIVRLVSVLLGAVTVFLTYRLGREVEPTRPEIGLGAAAVNAFLPMFLFISGAVNNDNLAIMLSSLALILMVTMVTARKSVGQKIGIGPWIILGSVLGLAALTKEGTLGLFPLAAGTAFVAAWQWFDTKGPEVAGGPAEPVMKRLLVACGRFLLMMAMVLTPALLIAGWWYYRNVVLYGDWLGWNAFIAVLGQRSHPASLLQLWGERHGFMMSYWGLFGGVNVPMPAWIYAILNMVMIASVIGFSFYLIRLVAQETGIWTESPDGYERRLLRIVERNFGLIVSLLFSAAVVYGLVQWATTTWSSQGRLVFTAISALSVLMVLGLAGLLPVRLSRWAVGLVAGFMFLVAAAAPFLWIGPAYTQPVAKAYLPQPAGAVFGDRLRLHSYAVDSLTAQPGDPVQVRLQWEALAEMERDYSVFVHLVDPVLGQPVAQRDMFPGQGLVSTRFMTPGQPLVNRYWLTLPDTAVAPADLQVAVGIYDHLTGERLLLDDGSDSLVIGNVVLSAAGGALPNPVSIVFEGGLELVGFEVDPRRTTVGEAIELVTYWQVTDPLSQDYTFFAQVVDETTTRYAGHDRPPDNPTSSWLPGEVMEIHFELPIDPLAPAGTYPLILGMYTRDTEGGFDRLQLVTENGRLTDDFLELTRIRLD